MDIEIAKAIVKHMSACDVQLNDVAELIEKIEDTKEKKIWRRKLADVVGSMYAEILRPIEIEHPSLTI